VNKKPLQIAAWLAGMALALGIAMRFWSVAFPVAALPAPLPRGEVKTRMSDFLASVGGPVSGYVSGMRFDEWTGTKNFIERQYGPGRLDQAVRDGIAVWYWTGRWFKPGQHEEYRVSTDQQGNIVAYTHIIEEERALPTLTESQALALAGSFLREQISRHPPASLQFLETGSERKPNRTDYTFTWEDSALRIGDAPYRLSVTVQGNEIGSYVEYLKVPEWWTVEYQRQRSVNDLCYRLATFASSAIALGLLIYFLIAISNHQVRWLDAVPWGWFVVMGMAGAATQINSIPEIILAYPTTAQWQPYVANSILGGAWNVLTEVLGFWALVLVGDCIYRERLPGKASFRRALGPLGLRDPQTVRAIGVGIAFATFSLAYACVFYAVGQRIGVWCPVEVDLSKTMSGPMPWVEAMQTGLTAAFTEEVVFRVGAVLLLWRILRVRWLAVVLAAAAWGFMHSNYPQMPGYTRGIELTIVGIVWGILLLRYGVVASLTAHYLYDCWIGSFVAFQGTGLGNKAGAIIVCLWPVALFLWAVARKQEASPPEEACPHARPEVPRPPAREWKHFPLGLDGRGLALLLLGCVAMLSAIIFLPRPQDKVMKLGKLDLSREAIVAKADAALRDRGYPPDGYKRVVDVEARGLPAAYLLEHGSLDRLAQLYDADFSDLYWSVRYFRFLQPEEFSVQLDQHGRFLTWDHTLLREAPGAELPEPRARALAGNALERDARIDLSRQELVQETPGQQEHRRDWLFAFDQRDFNWGGAKLRTYIRLQGNEPVSLTRIIKVPDAWLLDHAKKGWKEFISGEFDQWTSTLGGAILCVLLIMVIRKHLTPWRKAFLYALFPLGIKLVDQLNQSGQFFAAYATTTPRIQYIATQLGSRAENLIWSYLAAVFEIAVALGLLHWAWGWTPDQVSFWPKNRQERGLVWRDTLLVAFASIVAFWSLDWINVEVLGHFWPVEVASIYYWKVEEWLPCVGPITQALQDAYDSIAQLAFQASVLKLVWDRRPKLAWALLLLIPVLNLPTTDTLGSLLWHLIYDEASLLLKAWLVLKVWRFNLTTIFLTYAMSSLLASTALLLQKGGPTYQWQAAPLILLMLAAPAVGWRLHKRSVAHLAHSSHEAY